MTLEQMSLICATNLNRKTYPKWLPKDMIADWLEAYAIGQNLVIWLSSTVLSDPRPVYDEEKRSWTVAVERNMRSSDGGTMPSSQVCIPSDHIHH